MATNPNPFFASASDQVTDELKAKTALVNEQNAALAQPPAAPAPEAPAEPAPQPSPEPVARGVKTKSNPADDMPPPALRPVFEASAKHFDIPVNVLMAIGHQESRYNANAVGQPTQYGTAKGMMQNLDATAKGLGINAMDPNEAIPAAAKQIRERLDKGYSMEDAVKEHFAGPDRKQWGAKTEAYGVEVMDTAGRIGSMILGEKPAAAEQDPNANRMGIAQPRAEYEQTFRANNPNASPAAVQMAMTQYDQQKAARGAQKIDSVAQRFDTLKSPEATFDAKLNQKLAGPAAGVVPALPSKLQPAAPPPAFDEDRAARESEFSAAASYLGKSFKSGVYDLMGAGAKVLDEVNPFTVTPQQAATLFKDDPKELRRMQDESVVMVLSRFAKAMSKNSEESIADISDRAKRDYGNLEYATTDTDKAAYLSPVKVIGDAMRSLPTSAAMAVSVYLTRGAAATAERTALAAGLSAEAAKKAGVAAAARTMATAGAASEGTVGYAQQALQTAGTVAKMSQAEMEKSPQYQELLKNGYTPQTAREQIIADTGEQAGKIAGIVDAAVNQVGGQFLGKILSEGGKLIPRIMKGAANESATEFVQSAGEQGGENLALKDNVNPNQDLTAGVGEAAVAGAAVGGLMGGVMAGAGGRGTEAAPARAPVSPLAPTQNVPVPAAAVPDAPISSTPLTSAVNDSAAPPARVVVTNQAGSAAVGTVAQYEENDAGGFTAQIIGDDGQVYTITDADGVQLAPVEEETGPLSSSVDAAAEDHAAAPAPAPAAALAEVAAVQASEQPISQRESAQPDEAPNGTDKADDVRADDVGGRSAGPVAGDGRVDGLGDVPAGVDGDGRQPADGRDGGSAQRSDPAPDAAASVSADEQPALTDWKRNPYSSYQAASAERAQAYMEKKGADPDKFEVRQTGAVRWQIMPKDAAGDAPTVRMYHGGEPGDAKGALWFSQDKKYAQGYANKSGGRVWYVDVPADHPSVAKDAEFGVLPAQNVELPADIAVQRKLLSASPKAKPGGWQEKVAKQEARLQAEIAKANASEAERKAVRESQKTETSAELIDVYRGVTKQWDESARGEIEWWTPSKDEAAKYAKGKLGNEAGQIASSKVDGKKYLAVDEQNYSNEALNAFYARGDIDGVVVTRDGKPIIYASFTKPAAEKVPEVAPKAQAKPKSGGKLYIGDIKPGDQFQSVKYGRTAPTGGTIEKAGRVNIAFGGDYMGKPISGVKLERNALIGGKVLRDGVAYDVVAEKTDQEKAPRRKGKAAADDVRYSIGDDSEYRDEHRAPGREEAAPLSDLTGDGNIYPDDVYSANGQRYYGTGATYDREAFQIASKMRNKPDAEVTIYRAIPSDVTADINPGDWVAITKQYAIDHGESRFDGDYKIITKKVRAGDIFTNGDSIQEWGYDPEDAGKYSIKGGVPQAEFGPVHAEYRDDAAGAVKRLMDDKNGEAIVHRDDVGDVSLVYGDGKMGLSHIAERRGAAFMARLPGLLRDGTLYSKPGQKDRVFIGTDRDEAVLRFEWDGKAKTWLLSAYEKYPDLKPAGAVQESRRSETVEERSAPALSIDALRQSVTRGVLGKVIGSMIDAGLVVLHTGPKSLPKGVGANVRGVQAATTPDGKIHLVASNLTAANARAVMLHEAFHEGAEKLLGTEQWGALMGRVGSLYRQGEQSTGKAKEFFDKARKRVAAAKAKGGVATKMEVEEFAAYAIEEYESAPASVRKWVDDLIAMVKAWMVKRFGKQIGQVTPAQLSAMARWALMDHAVEQSAELYGDRAMLFSMDPERSAVSKFADQMREKFPGLRVDLMPKNNGDVHLSRIVVPLDQRNSGTGTAFMQDLAAFADENGLRVVLSPSADFGGSKARLIPFYKRFGFVENKGRNKDFSTMEAMYREPQGEARYSVAGSPTGNELTPAEQGRARKFQELIQDNINRVRQVQKRIEEVAGVPLSERNDYVGAEINRPGRIAARLEDAESHLTAPLMKRLAKSGFTQKQLSELLHAMHAKERNEVVAKINPKFPDGGSGMTNDEAEAILTLRAGDTELHAIADQARAIAKATLDLKLAYENIKQEDYDTYANGYEFYVPLKGDGEYGPKVKRAMGHDEREEYIVENIARDYQQAVIVGEKNLARQSLARMMLQNPDPELWSVGAPPKGRYVAGKVYTVRDGNQDVATFTARSQVDAFLEGKGQAASNYTVVDSAGEQVKEFAKPLQDNEVMVYFKGDPVRLQFHDKQLANQIRPLNQGQMGQIMEFMRGANRYLSKIYTGYNPAFILRNVARDLMTGTINMLGNNGAAVAAKAYVYYLPAINALGQYAATGKPPAGKIGNYMTEYRMNGGKTGASWMSDFEQQGKTLERLFDDAYGAVAFAKDGRPTKAAVVAGRKFIGGMAHVVEIANQATENGLRLSLYIALREKGATPGKAAQAAKSVTVDFDRKGTATGALGALYLFFNPAVQGTANAIKALSIGKHRGQAWAALGGLAALGAYAASAGLDDDKDRWLGEGWDLRTKNLILNIGDKQLRIPLSQEYAPAYALGVALAEARSGESKMRSAARLVSSFIDAYFPFQGAIHDEGDKPGQDFALAMTPTIIKPAVTSAFNRNSFGSQIVPETETTKDRPDNLKMNRGTKNTVYDKSAQGIASLGEMMGAGKYENDITKVSPETLKMLWRTYTGGLGQFVTDTASLAYMGATDRKQLESGDYPFLKDFVKTPDVKPIQGRYYDLSGEARKAITEFQMAKKLGDGDAQDKFMEDATKVKALGLTKMITKTNKAVGELKDEAVEVNADTKMSPTEKRARLKELEREQESLYRDAIEVFKQ